MSSYIESLEREIDRLRLENKELLATIETGRSITQGRFDSMEARIVALETRPYYQNPYKVTCNDYIV